jgi:hypothetical protein
MNVRDLIPPELREETLLTLRQLARLKSWSRIVANGSPNTVRWSMSR